MPASILTTVGLGVETTWGTTVPIAHYLPVTKHDWEDDVKRVLNKGKRGVSFLDYGAYPGVTSASLEYGGDFFPDICGYLLYGIFGTDNVTSVSTTYTHKFTVANVPPSFTWYDYYAVEARQFPGAQLSELTIKWARDDAAPMTWDAKFVSQASTVVSKTTPTITTIQPFLGWQASITIGGTTNIHMLGGELTFKRDVKLVYGASNSQVPNFREINGMEVTGKLDFYMVDSSSEYQYFVNATTPPVNITLTNGLYQFTFFSQTLDFEKGKPDRSQEYVRFEPSIRAHWDSGTSSPYVQLTNLAASYTS